MTDTKLLKAYCHKTNQFFGLEIMKYRTTWRVVNMVRLSEEEARVVCSEVKQESFETNSNLIPCAKCGNRMVGGCSCPPKRYQCSGKMKYQFDCIYCKHLKIDYSLPTGADVSKLNGDTVTLSQGKEVKVATFSNVEWTKFDNIQSHPSGNRFGEPKVHVIANEENIEFHGYNISEMDEGVYYIIGKNDDFEIECNVDTTTIKPHPGGHFYISFGTITARISEKGDRFFLDEKPVAQVGAQFKMKLSLKDGGNYEIFVDGQRKGATDWTIKQDVKIVFGFSHDSHYCELLSHVYISGIKMQQGVSQQN